MHLRSREKDWSSLTASDSMTITDERLDFLKKTTDAVTRMVEDLTGHKETCGKGNSSDKLVSNLVGGYRQKVKVTVAFYKGSILRLPPLPSRYPKSSTHFYTCVQPGRSCKLPFPRAQRWGHGEYRTRDL